LKNIQTPVKLGDQLIQAGLISEKQLILALKEQKRVNEPLGRILISLGFITETILARILAEQKGIPFISLKDMEFDENLVRTVSSDLARQHLFIPIKREFDGNITVAMANPSNVISVDVIQEYLGSGINIVSALEHEISNAISNLIEINSEDDLDAFDGQLKSDSQKAASLEYGKESYVDVVDKIFEYALRNQATDIHFEPEKKLLRIRYRIDGILHAGETYPKEMISPILTRTKIMGGLDITERRLPQDGRISKEYNQRIIDYRVSSMPTAHGENIVIRILDRGSVSLNLKELGASGEIRKSLSFLVNRPYGMILVSGPTGSGKTTTLYSLLLSMDSMTKKIVTVEDPIEYELPLIRQSQVDPTINYSFAEGLRTILRQDPDIILVGEIRDRETAEVALRASLTGHIVLASIHTNNALGAVPRLLDIGIDPFLINSSLSGVIAQRLVRGVCTECMEDYRPSKEDMDWLGITDESVILHKPMGCPQCRNTGYTRRTALYELFKMDNDFTQLISQGANENKMEEMAKQKGMSFMVDDGKRKVIEGITTANEVLRVCQNL